MKESTAETMAEPHRMKKGMTLAVPSIDDEGVVHQAEMRAGEADIICEESADAGFACRRIMIYCIIAENSGSRNGTTGLKRRSGGCFESGQICTSRIYVRQCVFCVIRFWF